MNYTPEIGNADLSIQRYADTIHGDLIVVWPIGRYRSNLLWLCFCRRCGGAATVHQSRLANGSARRCGLCALTQRGLTSKRGKYRSAYDSYRAMMQRCYDQRHAAYQWYGRRGISVCARWRESFRAFVDDMGQRPVGKTLDRRDPAGNYTPENCRWATPAEQRRNQRPRRKAEQK